MRLPDDPDWNERIEDAVKAKLSALLTTGVREISYVYDMGDNWQHRIIVEKLKTAEPGVLYPQFLGGRGDARRRIAAAFPAITNSWTILPVKTARNAELPSNGMEGRIIRMISGSRR